MRRKLTPGIDLPAWFCSEIKGIDNKLTFVWHPFRTLYEDVMNEYSGSFEDSRHNIQNVLGQELWGFPLKDLKGAPIPDQTWHIWRHAWPHGFTHVVKVESKEDKYLAVLLERLHLQANMNLRDYRKYKEAEDEAAREKEKKSTRDYLGDINKENAPFFRRAMENALSGKLNPTNPTKDSIISYPGQHNRSRIIRPLDDHEGGLIIPDHLKR